MNPRNFLNEQTAKDLYRNSLSKGDVFLGKFDKIDHEKFFVIAGLSQDKIFICSVFINSNIPDFIFKKQELLNLQIPIKGSKYDFLKYDSFVSCNTQLKFTFSDVHRWIDNKKCRYIGKLDLEDISNIKATLINSGLLTSKEIKLYF